MFNKPSRRKKLYAILVNDELVGVFPTKKMAQSLQYNNEQDVKKVIPIYWTGGFYTTNEEEMYSPTSHYRNIIEQQFDF